MNAQATASNLDLDKLRKVRALMDGGKTPGERAAARTKAETIAARAGMTLKAALSRLDAPAQPQPGNFFSGFDDWMEAKEPGYKAREAQRRAEKEAARLERCRDLLAEFGSEDAVFAPTDAEAAVRAALAHLEDEANTLWGYRDFKWCDGPTPDMWAALHSAGLVPGTVAEAWAAYLAHEARSDARCTFCWDYTPWQWEEAWRSALEWLLDNLHSPTVEGITARLAWLEHRANQDMTPDPRREQMLAAALQADFAAFVQSGRGESRHASKRTAQRRADIRDLLRRTPGLSDREIARRAGCSPQTVGNIRRRVASEGKA